MNVFIVAIPLFDNEMTVKGYQLQDKDADMAVIVRDDFRDRNEEFDLPGLDLIKKVGVEPFAMDMPLFVEINQLQFLAGIFETKIPAPNNLVWALSSRMKFNDIVLDKLDNLKSQGSKIAINGYPKDGIDNYLITYADYIILNYNDDNFKKEFEDIKKNMRKICVVVTNIPDIETYNSFSNVKNTLFTGQFYNNPITDDADEIVPVKVNALRLMKQINEDDFELTEIAQIIERDPALSISLLRSINSKALGLGHQVTSIKNAVAILGQKEVRRWATIAISISFLADDRPGEITKLSLVRARFAENLAPLFEKGVFQHSLFMAGLFSLLDVILKKPMEEAIKEVAVDNMVYAALVEKKGVLFKVLDFIYKYEHADWNNISIIMIQNNISGEDVNKAFVEALVWYHQLLISIDEEKAESEMVEEKSE